MVYHQLDKMNYFNLANSDNLSQSCFNNHKLGFVSNPKRFNVVISPMRFPQVNFLITKTYSSVRVSPLYYSIILLPSFQGFLNLRLLRHNKKPFTMAPIPYSDTEAQSSKNQAYIYIASFSYCESLQEKVIEFMICHDCACIQLTKILITIFPLFIDVTSHNRRHNVNCFCGDFNHFHEQIKTPTTRRVQ